MQLARFLREQKHDLGRLMKPVTPDVELKNSGDYRLRASSAPSSIRFPHPFHF